MFFLLCSLKAIISCDPNPCGIHGSCMQAILLSGPIPYCTCENGWTGKYCDVTVAGNYEFFIISDFYIKDPIL